MPSPSAAEPAPREAAAAHWAERRPPPRAARGAARAAPACPPWAGRTPSTPPSPSFRARPGPTRRAAAGRDIELVLPSPPSPEALLRWYPSNARPQQLARRGPARSSLFLAKQRCKPDCLGRRLRPRRVSFGRISTLKLEAHPLPFHARLPRLAWRVQARSARAFGDLSASSLK